MKVISLVMLALCSLFISACNPSEPHALEVNIIVRIDNNQKTVISYSLKSNSNLKYVSEIEGNSIVIKKSDNVIFEVNDSSHDSGDEILISVFNHSNHEINYVISTKDNIAIKEILSDFEDGGRRFAITK